jgi:hypothetical protein
VCLDEDVPDRPYRPRNGPVTPRRRLGETAKFFQRFSRRIVPRLLRSTGTASNPNESVSHLAVMTTSVEVRTLTMFAATSCLYRYDEKERRVVLGWHAP